VRFGLGASIHDWNDPFGRLFLQTLAMVAEFEANLIRLRTREGMADSAAEFGSGGECVVEALEVAGSGRW
jgi:DNA invertase Pin-like site-specific DNA recombinase